MTKELREEWKRIMDEPDLYIYGAAKTAERIYNLITQMESREKIRGFLVSDSGINSSELCGLPVLDIHQFQQKEVRILIPHMGVYKEQIAELLTRLGFKNIVFISQLLTRAMKEECENAALDHRKVGWEIYDSKSENEKERDTNMRKKILHILQEGQPDFGCVKPYQSLEMIGLEGARPTEYRIREYGLRKILRPEYDILDIGCNSGFLDMSVAGLVHSVTGVEYDKCLVNIADLVRSYLKLTGCTFYNNDFNNWFKDINTKYHVIFSFAVHHWLNTDPVQYIKVMYRLLHASGYVCFESHNYEVDAKFDDYCMEFEKAGFNKLLEKMIKDDGLQERKYVLFQKRGDADTLYDC